MKAVKFSLEELAMLWDISQTLDSIVPKVRL